MRSRRFTRTGTGCVIRTPRSVIFARPAINIARSVLRKRQTARRHLRLARQEFAEPADSELLLATAHQQVLAAVRQLPPRQREVLALRYWANLSETEIAQALSISRGAVKSNASRGMDKLETILGDMR